MLIKFAISLGGRPRALQPDVERGVNLCNASCTIQNGKLAADRENITVTGLIILNPWTRPSFSIFEKRRKA